MEEQNENQSSMPNQEGEGKNGGMVGKIIGLVVVVLVIALGVYALTRGNGDSNGITPEAASTQNEEAAEAPAVENVPPVATEATTTPETAVTAGQTVTVVFTDAGYAPASVTIKKGDSVMFKNESALETWPASAMHPTHTVYPGSDIQKCGTPEQAGIFDACRGLKTGETYTFQFNNVGKWNYHDHINLGKYGSIEVME